MSPYIVPRKLNKQLPLLLLFLDIHSLSDVVPKLWEEKEVVTLIKLTKEYNRHCNETRRQW